MLRPDRGIACVYLHRAPIDMRKQMNGLAALVESVFKQNPFSGSLFVFINRRRDKLKMLVWDRSGFIVWYKRLEAEKFYWPVKSTDVTLTISGEQLQWLLDGYDIGKMRAHKSLQYLSVA